MSERIRQDHIPIIQEELVSVAILSHCSFLHSSRDVLSLMSAQRILLNGQTLTQDVIAKRSDSLLLLTPQSLEPSVATNYSIVYADDFLVVVDKPANLPVHPAGKYYFNTLVSLLADAGKKLYPVNRLDRETSGLVLFATSPFHTRQLQELYLSSSCMKTYFAVVFGIPSPAEGLIDAPLLQGSCGVIRDHVMIASSEQEREAKVAKTAYKVIESTQNLSLVQLQLLTGRRHQIRAHLAHLGHSLVGDKQYGLYPELFTRFAACPDDASLATEIKEKLLFSRHVLHCAQLSFHHPQTGEKLLFSSNIAKDMLLFLNESGFTSFPL